MPPNFSDRTSWYNTPLIRRNDGGIKYTEQRRNALDAFAHFNLNCSKKTHLGRDIAVSVCTQAGLSESSMKRHGKYNIINMIGFWKIDSFAGAYQSRALPYDVIRVLAGFHQDQLSYTIKRDLVKVPQSLLNKTFPWVDESLQEINDLIKTKAIDSEHSGNGFLCMLKYLRKTFVQDAAAYYLESDFRNFEVFGLELFQSDEFLLYKQKLQDVLSDNTRDIILEAGTERKLTQLVESHLDSEVRDIKILEKIEIVRKAVGMKL